MVTSATIRTWKTITAAGNTGFTTRTFATVFDPTGKTVADNVPIVEASWAQDGSDADMTSGQITVPAIDWSNPDNPVDWRPTTTSAPLTPFGNRIKVVTRVGNGVDHATITLGVGIITTVTYQRPEETLTVQIGDLNIDYRQAEILVDFTLKKAAPLGQVLTFVSAAIMPGPQLRFEFPTNITDPKHLLAKQVPVPVDGRTWNPGTAVWEIMQDCADAVAPGARFFFNRDGKLAVDRLTVDTTRPSTETVKAHQDFELRTGDGGHITEMVSELTRDGAINVVAVAVEDTEVKDPVYADPPADTDDTEQDEKKDDTETVAKGDVDKILEDVKGWNTAAGMADPVKTGGFTKRDPVKPRWPFGPGHPMGAPFGARGSVWSMGWHTGADFSAPSGGTVVSCTQGKVVAVYPSQNGPESGWAGKYVVVQASDKSRFYYCHLASTAVKKGQWLRRGDTIGKAGATGRAFGIHLHLERRVPPYRWATDCRDWRFRDVK